MSFFLAFWAFAALVVLHEFGHFLAAKKVGMQVTRFSLFFPPAIFKHKPKNSETSYEIGALPLGGFVKITGMNPEEEIPNPADVPRAYFNQPVWKRIVVILAGPAMNVLIAFLLIFVLFAFVGTAVGPSTQVEQVAPDAAAAGQIEPGDTIVAINGVSGGAIELVDELAKSKCAGKKTDGCEATEPVAVTIERDGVQKTFKTTPRYDAENERMRVGVSFGTVTDTVAIPQAIEDTTVAMWEVTKATVSLPARIIDPEKRKEISSVVGGYESTRIAIDTDVETTIKMIALISLSLAIINMFPFLPLDGGHILWAVIEKIRGGRPVPVAVLERASFFGLALVLMLFAIGLTNDIDRFQNGGFGPK